MKPFIARIILCVTILFCNISVNAQQFDWVKGGGTLFDELDIFYEGTYHECIDPNGNVYALSYVANGTVYADTFTGTASEAWSILLTSYNCEGQTRWVKLITSTHQECDGVGIVADSSGHIYVAGSMPNGTLKIGFDTTITTNIYQTLSVIQFDTSGHFNWIRKIGSNIPATFDSTIFTYNGGLCLDNAENVHFIFHALSNVTLAPGVTSVQGCYDMKYDASGNLLSTQRLGLDSTLNVYSAVIDKQSNKLYTTGYRFYGTSSFYAYIAEFDTSRNQVWIDTLGDNTTGGDQGFWGITTDGIGHLYLAAGGNNFLTYRGDTIKPAPGAFSAMLSCIIKTDTAGNLIWAKQCNGNSVNNFGGITFMPGNKIAAVGSYDESLAVGPIVISNVAAGSDVFICVVDTGGTLIALKSISGDGYNDYGNTIVSDKVGNLYIGGSVEDSIPTSIIPAYHSHGGVTDFFVLKYGVDCDCTAMPVANFTVTGTSSITATYTGSTAPSIDSVVWNFGDGHTATGITANHVYSVYGTADLCVTVYTGCGYDIYCKNIIVNCTGPLTSSFTDTGATVRGFTYTGTTAAFDSVKWNYGDGHTFVATSATVTALHTYSTSGTYTACATVYTNCGSNTACSTIVINCAPVSSFTHSGISPVSFTYTGTMLSLDSVVWNFGDGHTGTGTTPSHTYTASGTYSVCATVYTACSSNTFCEDVVVNCSPTASFTNTGTATRHFTYTGSTLALSGVSWSYGDGSTGTGSTATHTYTATGIYTVCATAITTCGNDTACDTVNIMCVGSPTVAFTYTVVDTTGTVTFDYAGTTYLVDSVVWNFGDGHSDTGLAVSHTYSTSGTFHICVTVYTGCGIDSLCSDAIVHSSVSVPIVSLAGIKVFPNPVSDELTITGVALIMNYRLLTVTGISVSEGVLQKGNNVVSMQGIAPGVYVLEMTDGDGERNMVKVVKE